MRCLKVVWDHDHADEPLAMYSECDDARWEVRKVEVLRDGRLESAGPAGSSPGSQLGLEPLPDLTEIASQPEFHPEEITRSEFEAVWSAALEGGVSRQVAG